ncbi:MAG: hypothetical protein AAF066_02415 [Pseudomonadota bacterium]
MMLTGFAITLVSLGFITAFLAIEIEKLVPERPRGAKEWTIGLLDAWTKAQISYLKNLHWVLLSMIAAGIVVAALLPTTPKPYPFDYSH